MKSIVTLAGGLAVCLSIGMPGASVGARELYEPSLLPPVQGREYGRDSWNGPRLARLEQEETVAPQFSSPLTSSVPTELNTSSSTCSECGGGGCESCGGGQLSPDVAAWGAPIGFGSGCCGKPWYAGVRGLIMSRSLGCDVWLSADSAYPATRLLTTRNAAMGWAGGFETVIGRYLNDCWAIEGGYWSIYPDSQEANVYANQLGGNLVSRINFAALQYNNNLGLQQGVDAWFATPSQLHRLRRDYDFQNIELNLVRNALVWGNCGAGPRARFQFIAGARYLKFGESLQYSTDYYTGRFGDDLANELHYNVRVRNELVGFQLGGRYEHYLGCRWLVYANAKSGIYNNHITHHQDIRAGNGQFAYLTSRGVDDYNINSSKDDVAMISELDLGLSYWITPCWRISGGYRALGLTSLAFATEQIPPNFGYYDSNALICSSNSMILHGGYAGVEFNW